MPPVAPATTDLYSQVGDAFSGYGPGDAALGWPLLRWLDGIGQIMQRLNDLALDDDAGNPGWSVLLDPTRCPNYALPWLAQWVGVRFDPKRQATPAAQRAAITAEQGWQRGTLAAIQAAAAPYLSAGQSVKVNERDTSPYHFTVVVSTGSVNGQTYADLDAAYATYADADAAFATYEAADADFSQGDIIAALEAAKPAGLVMDVVFTTANTYSALDAGFATYADTDAAFADYTAADLYT